MIVIVEIIVAGREPLEIPAHSLLKRFQLFARCPRDGYHGYISMIQMNSNPVKIISPERTTRAALVPIRRKHEVIHHELASALKQLSRGRLSTRPIKDIILLYLDPGQIPALPAQLIAETGKLFLLDQKLFSRLEPFVQ